MVAESHRSEGRSANESGGQGFLDDLSWDSLGLCVMTSKPEDKMYGDVMCEASGTALTHFSGVGLETSRGTSQHQPFSFANRGEKVTVSTCE